MKHEIEWTAEPRRNVSQRRADFYRALPDRIETGVLPLPKPPVPDDEQKRTRRDRIHARLLQWKERRAARAAVRAEEDEQLRADFPEYPIPGSLGPEVDAMLVVALIAFVVLVVWKLS